MLHPLLQRQLHTAGASSASGPPSQAAYDALLAAVSETYCKSEPAVGTAGDIREVVASAPIAMAMLDRDMRYQAWSRKWLADYGLAEHDLAGRSHYEVFPDLPERWKEIHRRCLQGEFISQSEDRFDRGDGSRLWLRWAVHPCRAADGSVAGLVMVTDRIDDLVLARDAALEAARVKADFLSNMTHELLTPLNGVLGMSELLLDSHLDADQRDQVEMIRASGDRLARLVDDLLDLAPIGAGGEASAPECYEPRALVAEVAGATDQAARCAGLRFTQQVAADVPRLARGDAARLRRVLRHLLENAVKFTPAGEVSLDVRLLPVGASVSAGLSRSEPWLQFEVRDTGRGIAPALAAALFQPFTLGDGSPSRRHGGAGIGLALCRQLIESMGGRIELQSEPGCGTTARLLIGC